MWGNHNGGIPPLIIEVLRRFPGDPALRQATEDVSIRVNEPAMNGKEEWTNEPRKRKSDVNLPSKRYQITDTNSTMCSAKSIKSV